MDAYIENAKCRKLGEISFGADFNLYGKQQIWKILPKPGRLKKVGNHCCSIYNCLHPLMDRIICLTSFWWVWSLGFNLRLSLILLLLLWPLDEWDWYVNAVNAMVYPTNPWRARNAHHLGVWLQITYAAGTVASVRHIIIPSNKTSTYILAHAGKKEYSCICWWENICQSCLTSCMSLGLSLPHLWPVADWI